MTRHFIHKTKLNIYRILLIKGTKFDYTLVNNTFSKV